MIEQGRYKKLDITERICPLCKYDIEDEYHFTIECKKLEILRSSLFDKLIDVFPCFKNATNYEKCILILGSNDIDVSKICVIDISNMYTERLKML